MYQKGEKEWAGILTERTLGMQAHLTKLGLLWACASIKPSLANIDRQKEYENDVPRSICLKT